MLNFGLQMRRLQCEGRNERVKYLSSSKACLIMEELELNSYFFLRPVLAERGREKEVDH